MAGYTLVVGVSDVEVDWLSLMKPYARTLFLRGNRILRPSRDVGSGKITL
ncbi:hypothetical protein [Shimia sp. MIT1388]